MSTGSCVQCDSATDANCVGRASSIDAEPCNDPLTTKCYTSLVSGRIVRGCVSDLSSADKTRCSLGQDCHQCDASVEKCNTDIYPANRIACYTCIQPPCNSHESISVDYCPTYHADDQCVALRDATTGLPTQLGCKSSLSSTEQAKCTATSKTCRQCSTSSCNDPATFLGASSCVQCSSTTSPDCIGSASTFPLQPCNNPLNTQCYSRLTTEGATERGCLTDLDATSNTRCQSGTNCALCSSRDKCNIEEYPVQIKCFQCDSTQNDATCKNAQTYGTASYCKTYSTGNKCYTVVQPNGDTVRKCSDKGRSEECKGAEWCEECLFNGCNGRLPGAATTTTTTEQPHKGSANTNFAHSLVVALLLLKMMMMSGGAIM